MYLLSSSYILHLDLCKSIKVKIKEDKTISYFSVHNYKYVIIGMLIKTMKFDF